MALGKNTTIGKIEDVVRIKTGTVNDGELTPGMMIDLINFNVSEVAKMLNGATAPFYMTTATLTLSGAAYPLTSLAIDKIVKLVDGTNGQIDIFTPEDYERISSFDQYDNSVLAVQEGESIRITKGSGVTALGTITLHYYKIPTYASARTEYPDLPDSYTNLLIKMTMADVLAYKNKGVRDVELDKNIKATEEQIKQTWLLSKQTEAV